MGHVWRRVERKRAREGLDRGKMQRGKRKGYGFRKAVTNQSVVYLLPQLPQQPAIAIGSDEVYGTGLWNIMEHQSHTVL